MLKIAHASDFHATIWKSSPLSSVTMESAELFTGSTSAMIMKSSEGSLPGGGGSDWRLSSGAGFFAASAARRASFVDGASAAGAGAAGCGASHRAGVAGVRTCACWAQVRALCAAAW